MRATKNRDTVTVSASVNCTQHKQTTTHEHAHTSSRQHQQQHKKKVCVIDWLMHTRTQKQAEPKRRCTPPLIPFPLNKSMKNAPAIHRMQEPPVANWCMDTVIHTQTHIIHRAHKVGQRMDAMVYLEEPVVKVHGHRATNIHHHNHSSKTHCTQLKHSVGVA